MRINYKKTRAIIESLERQCENADCTGIKCKECSLVEKSIDLFGEDLITLEETNGNY